MFPRIFLLALFAVCAVTPIAPVRADNTSDIAALKAAVATLQAQVKAQQSIIAFFTKKTDATRTDGKKGTELFITGCNVHIVNGLGTTNGAGGDNTTTHVNGLGNLIVGYNAPRANAADTNFRTGSHNIVLGDGQNYSSYGGLLVGIFNTVSGGNGVAFGYRNTASGFGATATGGNNNLASGSISSVTGGHNNTASGLSASIAGGKYNTASGEEAAVAGGYASTASGAGATIGGGVLNTAEGDYSSVIGGEYLLEDNQFGFAAGGVYSQNAPGPGVFHAP